MTEEEKTLEALKLANEIRKFEIGLFWTRYNHMWLVNAAALAGYFLLQKDGNNTGLSFLVSCFGIVISFSWILMCCGSKWWHEAWELKSQRFEGIIEPGFFSAPIPPNSRLFGLVTRRFSVTGIATGMAVATALLWLLLAVKYLFKGLSSECYLAIVIDLRYVILFVLTILFCVAVWRLTRKK
jgi:hypothetical protein